MEQAAQALYQIVSQKADPERIWSDILSLNQWCRYTGTEAGEEAAAFIRRRLEECGVQVEWVRYPCYRSLPGKAFLELSDFAAPIPLTPYVFSGTADRLRAEIVFDRASVKGGLSQKENLKRAAGFRDKLVLTYDNSCEFAMEAARAGAKGVLHIWPANLAHHGSIGGVWGSPGVADLQRYPRLPFAEILKDAGEALRKRLETETVEGTLTVEMENNILTSSMPVAHIQGKSDDFVLVSGHYDGWHEGITDNACANAAMLELARVLHAHRDQLERSVVLAWWSGHSDGKYAGSTYYYDTHYQQLREHCVAHVNMDIAGCFTSDLVAFNTARAESERFDLEFLEEFNALPPQPPIPMARFADQTFWGAGVPLAIMPRFNRRELGDGIFYWWHTAEDTLDKADPKIVMRDYRVIGKLACLFAAGDRLPLDLTGFVRLMEADLRELESKLEEPFSLAPVFDCLPWVKAAAAEVEKAYAENRENEPLAVRFAGELTRLTYTASSPYDQDPAVPQPWFPGLSRAAGRTGENCTEEYFLALQTDFLRQRNRLVSQLEQLVRECGCRIELWRLKKTAN